MITITLPDQSRRPFDVAPTVADVAASIGAGLAKAALAGKVDGRLVDLSYRIESDAALEIVTDKHPDSLEVIRHSTAHLLAQATQRLFPDAQVTIGPVIENGFYYDFAREKPFTPDDLERIEAEMGRIVSESLPVERRVMAKDAAVDFFKGKGEHFKAEIIDDIIPAGEEISLYGQGEWVDLCRGPHVPNTSKLGTFKLMRVSGAYWRGDQNNQQLQRIYGTAWRNEKELKAYLTMLEEAEKRDHRKLGPRLDLFHFEDYAPGSVFWHPKGWGIFQRLIDYMRARQAEAGYVEVNTPDVMERSLWETSGHWFNYGQHMFTTKTEDERVFALKPMNCPGSVAMFKHDLHSYRDLPLRMAEFGKVHRYEPSGALHGLMRVRHFTQDDAHIYCTEEQMMSECVDVMRLIMSIYRNFGFDEVRVKLSTRPDNRIGDDATWDKLEGALYAALEATATEYVVNPGEGAFYGPKLEFVLRDAIGRDWQCGTLQVDLNLPERFDASYIASDGQRRRPVMLHRALFGSLERFIGILIEHHAGAMPLWLAPVQAVLMNITDAQADYAAAVAKSLKNQGFRVEVDLRNEKIGYKIREHTLKRVPFLLVVGDREKEQGTLSVRTRSGEDLGSMALDGFASRLAAELPDHRSPVMAPVH
jgi:threonyl-tRNA synthetase